MEKDIITITKEDNTKEDMEIVCIFNIKNYPYQYIIYTKIDHSKYYLAKYIDNPNELLTSFSEAEYKEANIVFNEVVNETGN